MIVQYLCPSKFFATILKSVLRYLNRAKHELQSRLLSDRTGNNLTHQTKNNKGPKRKISISHPAASILDGRHIVCPLLPPHSSDPPTPHPSTTSRRANLTAPAEHRAHTAASCRHTPVTSPRRQRCDINVTAAAAITPPPSPQRVRQGEGRGIQVSPANALNLCRICYSTDDRSYLLTSWHSGTWRRLLSAKPLGRVYVQTTVGES